MLPSLITGEEIYDVITSRLYRYLKSKKPARPSHIRTKKESEIVTSKIQDPKSPSKPGKNTSLNSPTQNKAQPPESPTKNIPRKNVLEGLQPMLTEDAVGGKIPPWGFSLRLVTGGYLAGDGCSRCHWLTRCQGCLVPRDNTLVSS